jgi:hypothetical protein
MEFVFMVLATGPFSELIIFVLLRLTVRAEVGHRICAEDLGAA